MFAGRSAVSLSAFGGEEEAPAHQGGRLGQAERRKAACEKLVRSVLFIATRVKSEGRRPKEGRNPKAEARIALSLGFRLSDFGTRPSFGPRPSGFGLQTYLTPLPSPLLLWKRGESTRAKAGG